MPCLTLFKLGRLSHSFMLSMYSLYSPGTRHLSLQQSAPIGILHAKGLPSSRLMGGLLQGFFGVFLRLQMDSQVPPSSCAPGTQSLSRGKRAGFCGSPLSQCWQHISCYPAKFGTQDDRLNDNLQVTCFPPRSPLKTPEKAMDFQSPVSIFFYVFTQFISFLRFLLLLLLLH